MKYLNFKIADAIEKYATNLDREKKELQGKLDSVTEEKEQLERELKKTRDQLAEMKSREYEIKETVIAKEETSREKYVFLGFRHYSPSHHMLDIYLIAPKVALNIT